jgi:hypothetical protein
MKHSMRIVAVIFGLSALIPLSAAVGTASAADQAAIVASELSAISNQLSLKPGMALDLSKVSGAYCFNAGLGSGGHMTHYAIEPGKTVEDVVDFVNAESLVKAGLAVDKLPRLPEKLGAMKPNQWYYLPAGEFEPHHGMKFSFPLMVRASDIK